MKAVDSGDVEAQQRMVDAAAKAAGVPTVGVNINDSSQDFTEQILSGEKTIETRKTKNNALSNLVGKRIALVRTGKGTATVVGYATVGQPIEYTSKQQFDSDFNKHRVSGGDFDFDGYKIGYPMLSVEKIESYPAPPAEGVIKTRPIHAPVTRGADGEVIPLSQRFNEKSSDNQ